MSQTRTGQYKRIVQYFWDPEPKNDLDPEEPIWCLGERYAPRCDSRDQEAGTARRDSHCTSDQHGNAEQRPGLAGIAASQSSDSFVDVHMSLDTAYTQGWPEPFLRDFESRTWITYRSNFSPIPKSNDPSAPSSMTLNVRLRSQLMDSRGFTSDTGWGCMIRSGQSLLANALSILRLGRDWRRGSQEDEESKVLSLFADQPDAPFSVHRFVQHGAEYCHKFPGEWFGPSATAKCIEALTRQCEDPELKVYVTIDSSDVFEERVISIAMDESHCFRPILILLGIRLGIENVNPVYWDALKAMLQYPQSIGIAGGRPSASLYFVGVQGSHLFYLDPHETRPALTVRPNQPYTEEDRNSYHTRRLRRLNISDMDPSMLIGFLIKSEEDWADWKSRVASTRGRPIIHISKADAQTATTPSRVEALDEVEALDDDFDDMT